MAQALRTKIVKIGNSQGVRLPKVLLEQAGVRDEVELEVRDHEIIMRPTGRPRAGWEEAFRQMAAAGDDRLLDEPIPPTRWEEDEWQW